MKHTTLASLFALGLASSAGAHAQTVNIFGIMDGCYVNAWKDGGDARYLNSGCMYGSRWGLRATEDLGGGLKAFFLLTSGFTLDNGMPAQGGRAFGRQSYVGLSGRFGTLYLGRDNPPTFWLLNDLDPFQGGWGNGLLSTGAPSTGSGRVDNGVKYISPQIGGFGMMAHGGFSEGTQGRFLAVNGTYRNGPLFAGGAVSRLGNVAETGTDKMTTVGVAYDFGVIRPSIAYQRGRWEGSRSPSAPSSPTSLNSRDYGALLVAASAKVGGFGRVFLSYKLYDDKTSSNFDATQYSAAYLHALSKRTDLYVAAARHENRRESRYAFADATGSYGGVAAGGTSNILAFGIKHAF
jgi:GBP family porin